MRLTAGDPAPPFTVEAVQGGTLSLASLRGSLVLLSFYRYASCPMCNLRLRDFARDFSAWRARGLQFVAFFHSSSARIRANAGARDYPFPLVADPRWQIYRDYRVETSWLRLMGSVLLPTFYRDWFRAMRYGFWGGMDLHLGTMPADFLVDPGGRIAIAYYGRSIGDHLPAASLDQALLRMSQRGG